MVTAVVVVRMWATKSVEKARGMMQVIGAGWEVLSRDGGEETIYSNCTVCFGLPITRLNIFVTAWHYPFHCPLMNLFRHVEGLFYG
jgi:hypothetical protein